MAGLMWEPIFIIMLVAADVLFTYVLMNKLIKLGKKKNYDAAESNPVIRFFVKKFGIHKGTRIAALYSVTAMTGVIYYLSIRYAEVGFRNMLYFIMGFYSLMLLVHISSFRFLSQQKVI